MNHHSEENEQKMINFYDSLSEKDRRRYAAIEALKIGHGGMAYICSLFGCDPKTIRRGLSELDDKAQLQEAAVRQPGGGRKKLVEDIQDIHQAFLDVLSEHTAGDPMNTDIRWTDLSRSEIAKRLKKKGYKVSRNIVCQLLKRHGYVKRKAKKIKATGQFKQRNQQFKKISRLKKRYQKAGNPVISIDTKKKEKLGDLQREGQVFCREANVVYDHDYADLVEGIVIPHGIYDLTHNDAMINIGISADTSEFACDSLQYWWNQVGKKRYSKANSLLILADCGGSNAYRHHVFKEQVQQLASKIGIEIRIAHYPPYTSKWNPIEHRVFCHVTRSLSGVTLKSYEQVKQLIEKTTTEGGLTVVSNILIICVQKG